MPIMGSGEIPRKDGLASIKIHLRESLRLTERHEPWRYNAISVSHQVTVHSTPDVSVVGVDRAQTEVCVPRTLLAHEYGRRTMKGDGFVRELTRRQSDQAWNSGSKR